MFSVTSHYLQYSPELRGFWKTKQTSFLPCHDPSSHTVRNTGTTFFFPKEGVETSVARRRRMSLNVWVKLMDCFPQPWPWPRSLLHLSHNHSNTACPLSVILSFFPLVLASSAQTSPFIFSHPCSCAGGHSSKAGGIKLTARQMHTIHAHELGWPSGCVEDLCSKKRGWQGG